MRDMNNESLSPMVRYEQGCDGASPALVQTDRQRIEDE